MGLEQDRAQVVESGIMSFRWIRILRVFSSGERGFVYTPELQSPTLPQNVMALGNRRRRRRRWKKRRKEEEQEYSRTGK